MRAHFGLPSVVGELNEGKVGFAFGFFSSQFWLKPRSNMNVFCSLQSMSSLRSPTSPPQASRSEFIKAEISQHLTELAVPQVRYLKIIEKSGYQVSLLTG